MKTKLKSPYLSPPWKRRLHPKLKILGFLAVFGFIASSAQAQSTAPAPASTDNSEKTAAKPAAKGSTLNTIVVEAVPLDQSIMPTARPFNSAYGLDFNIMDVPRNVTIISRTQLDAINIETVRDFSALTSSSYTRNNFGTPATPDIRGQSGDLYVNGMREGLTSSGSGLPIDFTAVESVNIVKGPANAVYGASQYVGGYVDLITKRPFFDKFQGSAELTVGTYRTWEQSLDFGGPIIKDELAYRVSYSGKEDGGYYQDQKDREQSGYLALSWTPKNLNYTLDFNAEYSAVNFTENYGYNRPTQALIDSGQYFTGTSPNTASVTPGGIGGLSQNARLENPSDGLSGTRANFQIIQSTQLEDNLKLVNNSFFQYNDYSSLDSYYYDEVLKDNISFENRTELHWDFDNVIGGGSSTPKNNDPKDIQLNNDPGLIFHNQVNTGVAEHYQSNVAYGDFASEDPNFWDMTGSPSNVHYPNPSGTHIPGEPGYYYFSPADGANTDSEAVSVGPFWQHHIDFTNQVALNYGARADVFFVDAKNPPGTVGPIVSSSTTQALGNFNVSPVYKPTSWLTSYFTYNYSQYTAAANGGGYTPEGSGNYWSSADYHRTAQLYETGLKFDLFNHTVFASVDAYIQNRIDSTQGSGSDHEFRRGIEAEINYQPNKEFLFTASYSLAHARTENPGYVNQLRPIDELPVVGGNVQGVDTGGVLAGYGKTPGVPEHTFNFLAQYQHSSGFGINIGLVATSFYNLSYDSEYTVTSDFSIYSGNTSPITKAATVVIPWQYTLNTSIFYKQPSYEIKLSFLNVTDQRNFSPVNAVYGNAEVMRDEPLQILGSVKYKF